MVNKYFHFTNIRAAIDILTTKKLRLTNVEYLNDHSENQLLFKSQFMKPFKIKDQSISLDEMIANALHSADLKSSFSLSLSKKGKNLAMWNGYSDDGVAIEFKLSNDIEGSIVGAPEEIEYLSLENIDEEFIRILNDPKSFNLTSFYSNCLDFSKNKKAEEFSYENEFRINYKISNSSVKQEEDVKYFYNGKIVKPFLEFDFDELGLNVSGVIMSSSIKDLRIKKAFERILENYGCKEDLVEDLNVDILESFYC